ncbi:MAG TPA: hypothetical protein ENG81_06485 [Candidatus Bathyarchaeota archaeon]|nr:hypothetical protein [Candidatus Bathyarchaeota archaeon]
MEGFYTSTIGSFPLEDSEANRERCIRDLITLGIDFPTYPQLTDMGKQFLDDLIRQDCGIIVEKGRYKLADRKIRMTVQPPGLDPFLWAIKYVKDRGLKVKIKAAITGPFTLSSYIEIRKGVSPFNTALSKIELIEQFAHIISESCRVASRDAGMISIDEPILGVIVWMRIPFKYAEEDIVRIFNDLRESCGNVLTGTHICGRISPKLANILLKTNLDFLSHEFYDSPENIRIYDPNALKRNGKILSVGCVSSKNPRIESPQEILDLMMKFKNYGECLIFTPDCGFRNLIVNGSREKGYEIAIKKLKNMVKAVAMFGKISH